MSTRDHYEQIHNAAGEIIRKYSFPVFELNDRSMAVKIGTGICLNIEDQNFVVTASHLFLERDMQKVGFLYEDRVVPFSGNVTKTDLPEDQKKDKYDIALCRLDEVSEGYLKKSGNEFYKFTEKDILDNYSSEINFIILGFPDSRTKSNPEKKKIKVQGLRFGTKLERILCNETDIVVQYEINSARLEGSNSYGKAPDPEGLSGSGIWHIKSLLLENPKDVEIKLCGIFRQFIKEKNIVYANKSKIIYDVYKKSKYK